MRILNEHLQGKKYIVGSRITLADIIVFLGFYNFFRFAADAEYIKPFSNVVAWTNDLVSQEQFKKVIGDFKFPEKEFPPNSFKF